MAQWAQTIIAAIVASAGALSGIAWFGARLGNVDSRVVSVERFVADHDVKWSEEHGKMESRVRDLEREVHGAHAEYRIRLQTLDKRTDLIEGLLQRFADLAPLTDRQKRALENGYYANSSRQTERDSSGP